MKVLVAPSARRDVLGVWNYIAKDNVAAADRMRDRISDSFVQLRHTPFLGESCPGFGANLRHYVVGVYVIFYAINEPAEVVEVQAVVHGARDLPIELKRRGIL